MKRLAMVFLFCLCTAFSMRVLSQSQCAEKLGSLPSLAFKGTALTLSDDQKKMLSSVAQKLRNNPGCRITITGYCTGSKRRITEDQKRVEAIRNYLVEREGINAERMEVLTGQEGGDCGTVDLKPE